jgi:hypothetical protein
MIDGQTELLKEFAFVARYVDEQGFLQVPFLDLIPIEAGVVLSWEDARNELPQVEKDEGERAADDESEHADGIEGEDASGGEGEDDHLSDVEEADDGGNAEGRAHFKVYFGDFQGAQ